MNILLSLKRLIRRINEIDRRSEYLSKKKCYSSNPFAFTQNKTYVWVERVRDFNKCGLFDKNPTNKHLDSNSKDFPS